MNRFVVCLFLWLQILQPSVLAGEYVNPLEDCSKCPETKYLINYYARNCTPVDKYNCKDCIMRFECPPVIQKTLIDEGCSYLGKRYAIGERIITRNKCEDCTCAPNLDDESSKQGVVRCAHIECPEMVFGYSAKTGNESIESKNCYFSYSHDECCGKKVCPSDEEMRNVTLCKYKTQEFKAGERIYPDEDECKVCICDEHWNPEKPVKTKSCKPVACSYKAEEEQKLMQGCTPVFEKGRCCPTDFICPENKRKVEPSASVDQKHDQLMCDFNGIKYKVGERLETPNPCMNCTCIMPPLFTCIDETCPHQPCDGVYKEGVCCPINECKDHKKKEKPEPLIITTKESCYPALRQQYSDMNCTAFGPPNCPTGYICPKLSDDELTEGCFADGRLFSPGSMIETRNPCTLLRCDEPLAKGFYPQISTGGYIECASLFRRPLPPGLRSDNKTCYNEYKQGECCEKEICLTENEMSAVKTCEFEGKKFKIGEKMYPSNKKCMSCLCTEDWKTELGLQNPSCRSTLCPPVQGLANRMFRGCAPIFETYSCCIDDYYCPNEQEKVFNPFKCVYQSKEYLIGSTLLLTDKCITCNCTTPPLFSCEKIEDCNRVDAPPVPVYSAGREDEDFTRLEHCELNGKIYNISEEIDFPDNPCLKCSCGSIAGISCTYAECPEMVFGLPAIPRGGEKDPKFKNCYFEYELDKCCGQRKCPTDEELANQKKCVINGKEYKLGQRIPSNDKCKRCICTEDFDSANPSSSGCRQIGCNNPNSVKKISRGCIPIYKEGECCPVDYFCGSDPQLKVQEAIILHLGVDYRSEEMKCSFNGTKYSVGDEVETNDICTRCSCEMPPMLSCSRKSCPSPPTSDCKPVYNTHSCCPTYECPNGVNFVEYRREKHRDKCNYPKIVEFYLTLGCEAETVNGGKCAYRFKCPNLKAAQTPSQESEDCIHLGKQFKIGENIDIGNKCGHCTCLEKGTSVTNRFACMTAMCAPLNNSADGKCYSSFEIDKCCGKVVCPEKIETCNYNEKLYRFGERIPMPPNLACLECLCSKGWNESDPESSPGCKRKQCMVSPSDNFWISNGCVPVYGENDCCPQNFFCPDISKSSDNSTHCEFKRREYTVGSKLQSKPDIECKCDTPPSITCKAKIV